MIHRSRSPASLTPTPVTRISSCPLPFSEKVSLVTSTTTSTPSRQGRKVLRSQIVQHLLRKAQCQQLGSYIPPGRPELPPPPDASP